MEQFQAAEGGYSLAWRPLCADQTLQSVVRDFGVEAALCRPNTIACPPSRQLPVTTARMVELLLRNYFHTSYIITSLYLRHSVQVNLLIIGFRLKSVKLLFLPHRMMQSIN